MLIKTPPTQDKLNQITEDSENSEASMAELMKLYATSDDKLLEEIIENGILNPIKFAQKVRSSKNTSIRRNLLRRSIMLFGDFDAELKLALKRIENVGLQNGFAVIHCDPAIDGKADDICYTARLLNPAIIFVNLDHYESNEALGLAFLEDILTLTEPSNNEITTIFFTSKSFNEFKTTILQKFEFDYCANLIR